jgi:hypothetical protein
MDSIGCPPVVTMMVKSSLPTERDERGCDDLAEVVVGNGALRDEDEALAAVELLPPFGQPGLAEWCGQSADELHLRVGIRILEALDARVQVEVG